MSAILKILLRLFETVEYREILTKGGYITEEVLAANDTSMQKDSSPNAKEGNTAAAVKEDEKLGETEKPLLLKNYLPVEGAEQRLETDFRRVMLPAFPIKCFPYKSEILEDGFRAFFCGGHIFYLVQYGSGAQAEAFLWFLNGVGNTLLWEPFIPLTPIIRGIQYVFMIVGLLLLFEGSPLRLKTQSARLALHEIQNVGMLYVYTVTNWFNFFQPLNCDAANKTQCLIEATDIIVNVGLIGLLIVPRAVHWAIRTVINPLIIGLIIFWWGNEPSISTGWKIWCWLYTFIVPWTTAVVFGKWEELNRGVYESFLRLELRQIRLNEALTRVSAVVQALLPNTVLTAMIQEEQVYHTLTATVVQADICNFTRWCSSRTSSQVVDMLSTVMSAFDTLSMKLNVTRVKVLGDGYIACAGAPDPLEDHADRGLRFALTMQKTLTGICFLRLSTWGELEVRAGVHSGHVSAGVLSTQRWSYDLFGPVPAISAVLEPLASHGAVLVSEETMALLTKEFRDDLTDPRRPKCEPGPLVEEAGEAVKTFHLDSTYLEELQVVEDVEDLEDLENGNQQQQGEVESFTSQQSRAERVSLRLTPEPELIRDAQEKREKLQLFFASKKDAGRSIGIESITDQLSSPLRASSNRRRNQATTTGGETTTDSPSGLRGGATFLRDEAPSVAGVGDVKTIFSRLARNSSSILFFFLGLQLMMFSLTSSSNHDFLQTAPSDSEGGSVGSFPRVLALLVMMAISFGELMLIPDHHKRVSTTLLVCSFVVLHAILLDESANNRLDRFGAGPLAVASPFLITALDIQPKWLYYLLSWTVFLLSDGWRVFIGGAPFELITTKIIIVVTYCFIRFFLLRLIADIQQKNEIFLEIATELNEQRSTIGQVLSLKMPEHVLLRIFSAEKDGDIWRVLNTAYPLTDCHVGFCLFSQSKSTTVPLESNTTPPEPNPLLNGPSLQDLLVISQIIDTLLPSDGTGPLGLIEKVKTIGDVVMIGGCLDPDIALRKPGGASAEEVLLELLMFREQLIVVMEERDLNSFQCLIGVHSGEVTAATIGKANLEYDVFGTTVNTAARVMATLTKGNSKIASTEKTGGQVDLHPAYADSVVMRCTGTVSCRLKSMQDQRKSQRRAHMEKSLCGVESYGSDNKTGGDSSILGKIDLDTVGVYTTVEGAEFKAKGIVGMMETHILYPDVSATIEEKSEEIHLS